MIIEYVVPKEFFNQLLEFSKNIKSTFIVIDKMTGLYGFDGEEYGNSNYLELGALKYIENNIYNIPNDIITSIVLYSKDIVSISKLLDEYKTIAISYNVFGNYYVPKGINVYDNTELISTFPVLDAYPFINKYLNVIKNTFNEEIDITDSDKFVNIVNMKASQGGGLFTVQDNIFFGIANLFHINKGDRAYISHNHYLVRFRIKKKKNIVITIIYKYLNL